MSHADPMREQELRGMLSALLDGELADDEERDVLALIDRSSEVSDERDALDRVRRSVRDLPPVDPPSGFYERMLLSGDPAVIDDVAEGGASQAGSGGAEPVDLADRRDRTARSGGPGGSTRARTSQRRRYVPKVVGAMVAAAAAFVFIVGLTPISDRVVPPVNAYAQRHQKMVEPVPAPAGSTSGTTLVTSGSTVATTTTIPAGTVQRARPDPTAPAEHTDGFVQMSVTELDQMGVPSVLTPSYRRIGGYRGDGGVLHLMYTDGVAVVSVYEQVGSVSWQSLPSSGTRMTVGSMPAWDMATGDEEVMVVERDTFVYTLVAIRGHDEMIEVVQAMPEPPAASMWDRTHHACRAVVSHFGFDT